MRMRWILGVATVFATACGGGDGSGTSPAFDGPTTVSYQAQIQPIWEEHCLGCHNFHTPHLGDGESRKNLLEELSWFECVGGENVPFVVPGKPEESFLLNRLTGVWPNDVSGDCVRPMPADVNGIDTPLASIDPDAVDLIRTWIAEGAADN